MVTEGVELREGALSRDCSCGCEHNGSRGGMGRVEESAQVEGVRGEGGDQQGGAGERGQRGLTVRRVMVEQPYRGRLLGEGRVDDEELTGGAVVGQDSRAVPAGRVR